jgi:hypothetical protein
VSAGGEAVPPYSFPSLSRRVLDWLADVGRWLCQDIYASGVAYAGVTIPYGVEAMPGDRLDYSNDMARAASGGGPDSLVGLVRELLLRLGESPGRVAQTLEATGVRGEPGNPDLAPVTRFLSAVVGGDPSVQSVKVDTEEVTVTEATRRHQTITVELPPAVTTFVRAFQAGCYPELALSSST